MAKSYYVILGISSKATTDDIKAAYRRLAKEFHPDCYSGGSEMFREIQEAYAVLGNPQRRFEYERQRSKKQHNVPVTQRLYREPEPLIPEESPIDLGDISPVRSFQTFSPSHDEIFDWLWNRFSSPNQPKSRRVQRLTMDVPLTREEALRGGTARVMVPARTVCRTCRGYGGIGPYECYRCAGEGEISGEIPIAIAFPPGLTRDHAVVVSVRRFGIGNTHLTVLFRPTGQDRE